MDLFCQAFDLLEMPKLFTLNEFTENMLLSLKNDREQKMLWKEKGKKLLAQQ